ncbi:MAG: bifunctional demethylmenaquinone methyltransferase/2-methoxy-6-polyprenyl-1,4-benzoquinol methylase UbiE [Saprospiraceae bacterium]|nr:bifunctional demethylmenaquinone methyltransferase/2-methoxy-6-polyprenyl-1,4-benzoquinol methylase UbiE [Saprospiraceae bacterium]
MESSEQSVVKPYEGEGDGKKKQVSRMFDRIAPYYDFLNRLLSLGIDVQWRKKMVQKFRDIKPRVLMDVATGTGDVALEIVKSLDPEKVVGMDISKEMLEIGKNKISKKGLSEKIEMVVGDSENIQFADNTFDGISVAFGVRNFENLDLGLKEMLRVLKPGGKLVILEFSKPKVFPVKQVFNGYFKYILPQIGKLTSKDASAYEYLYRSVQAFPDREAFKERLEKIGYKATTWEGLTFGICSIYTGIK